MPKELTDLGPGRCKCPRCDSVEELNNFSNRALLEADILTQEDIDGLGACEDA